MSISSRQFRLRLSVAALVLCAVALLIKPGQFALYRQGQPHLTTRHELAHPATLASFSPGARPATPARQQQLAKAYGQLPLSFEANQGQTAKAVRFMARGNGYNLFLTGTEALLTLQRNATPGAKDKGQSLLCCG